MKEAMIFTKCLGINDIKALHTQKCDPKTGETEVIDCINLTTTPDGALEKVQGVSTVFTHTAPIIQLTSGERFIFQDAIDTNEWNGVHVSTPFPLVSGPICHTPIDVRVNNGVKVYKSKNSASTVSAEAVLGTNPDPTTSMVYSAMPVFEQAFVYNAKLYCVNTADQRFLQYSKDYHYDLWPVQDAFFGHVDPIINAGGIYSEKAGDSGCILCMHDEGMTLYDGSGPSDFTTKFYALHPYKETMYSGFISKQYGYGHVFLCADGIFFIDPSGNVTNLTLNTFQHIDSLNTRYYCSIVEDGKFLAFGNNVTIEYDFRTKCAMKRQPRDIIGATTWNNTNYFAANNTILTTTGAMDDTTLTASVTFPYSTLGEPGAKSVSDLYFTGVISDTVEITATDEYGNCWTVDVDGSEDPFYNRRIKTPRKVLGNHLSFSVNAYNGGTLRIETLRAVFTSSQRSR